MNHHAVESFWRRYNLLPKEVRQLADKQFELLKSNPDHPSLHFKKTGDYWSVRVTIHYRALAVKSKNEMIWFWIGNHEEYNDLILGK